MKVSGYPFAYGISDEMGDEKYDQRYHQCVQHDQHKGYSFPRGTYRIVCHSRSTTSDSVTQPIASNTAQVDRQYYFSVAA
jgi:hypothetical protein